MGILNLVDESKSDIKYKISNFPDGQQNIVIESGKWNYTDNIVVQIKSRLNNWLDLELITCAVASLRELEVEEIHLYTPYIVGARSDRKFEEGGNNYLKDVICPIINSLNFKTVTCIDPHSDVLEACINNFRKSDNLQLTKWSIGNIYKIGLPEEIEKNFILVSPDAGASKKIYKIAEQIGYKGDIITCSKDRDENGKLTKCVVPFHINEVNKDMIIIDDIADGGGTFINIAKEIKEKRQFSSAVHPTQYGKIYLIVTHGIFSKGFEELYKYFDGIYCTNSYSIIFPGATKDFVKQLNVF